MNKLIKKLLIAIPLLVIIIITVLIFLKQRHQVTFFLNGNSLVTVSSSEKFIDPLFIAKNGYGKDLSKYVTVDDNIDYSKSGYYIITYSLNYLDYHNSLVRVVIVKAEGDYTLVLNGQDAVYTLLGCEYQEKGAFAIDNKTNEKIDISIIISNIDINKVGEYQVKYMYKNEEIIRKVIVFDIPYSLQNNNLNFEINLYVSDVPNYFNTLLPDGKYSYDNLIKYVVNNNGTYDFVIYDNDNNEYVKSIEITSIIKDLSCKGSINYDGTILELNGSLQNNVNKVTWIVDNKRIDGSTSLKIFNIVNNSKAEVTYNNGYFETINCNINNNLEYQFKYDENNTKPFMTCNSYTSVDKIDLDDKLSKSIRKVGYGTRAGVVEAARFIVGALDYKVPYLGPKTVNSELGRYQKVGLNIGNNSSWGCSISGYIQGLDCTNFVYWVFVQNGLKTESIYSTSNTYKTRNVINKIRVGDLLLSPCEGSCSSAFTHVGIIIGIDNNYIYVAEATAGNVNALIVSKWNKNDMPQKGKFSTVKLYEYSSEGNVTNMWLS